MTTITQEQVQAWLTEAYQARHELATGTATVSMSQGGRSLTFNQTSIDKLDAYIAWLEGLLLPATRRPSRLFHMTQTGDGYSGC